MLFHEFRQNPTLAPQLLFQGGDPLRLALAGPIPEMPEGHDIFEELLYSEVEERGLQLRA